MKRDTQAHVEMIRGKCAKCHHVYDVALSAMPLAVMAATIKERQTCPICGNVKMNMLDAPRKLTQTERDRHAAAVGHMKPLDLDNGDNQQ